MEVQRTAAVDGAIASGTIDASRAWLTLVRDGPADCAGILARTATGCVFHRAPGCAIQRGLGHEALPSACQHFPRICLIDPRGIFVTLSHYCPTAAEMLFEGDAIATILEGPAALPGGAMPEGLDARESLPPSLEPRKLMDLGTYAAWERRMVTGLTTMFPADVALRALGSDPSFSCITERKGVDPISLFEIARQAVPPPHSWLEPIDASPGHWSRLDTELRPFDLVMGRFLAAHAFASWMAYQGDSVAAMLRYLSLTLAVLRIETMRRSLEQRASIDRDLLVDAIRHTDLLLRHLADREALASALSA